MAPQDATMYWLSERTRNDLFLLYCFADRGLPTEELRAAVAERSARIADLRVRLRELPVDLDYPRWTRCEFGAEQFMEHELPDRDWSCLLEALGDLLGTGVDAAVHPWRLHVFRAIQDAPGLEGEPALVAVLQMSHALADGRRAAAIARALFTEAPPVSDGGVQAADECASAPGSWRRGSAWWPSTRDFAARGRAIGEAVPSSLSSAGVLVNSAIGVLRAPVRIAVTAMRGYQAFRAQQRLADLTASGEVPPPADGFLPTVLNRSSPQGISRHEARMLVFPSADVRVPGRTVTVVVLTAVSLALARYLAERGEPVERLGAQVPMALPEAARPRNNYRSLGVDLFVDEPDPRLRADKIAAALADRRVRALHPLLAAQDRVTAAMPAPLLRRDVDRYPLDTVPDSIAGHTVVSSVDRGPADLSFGGGAVRFTAGFPALGSVMHLTHGVHGLGDTVTISLHADPAVLPDLDAYAAHLGAALREAHRTRVEASPSV
ncbi:WS/DGAT domain-containing protein [Nocardia sp. CDC186]|uniref:WS/DGAT domain-containing protein n=1 Tax=Nocardia implantans TaxID=3108168 RepID=A0ABU6ANS4_9NOCA|nr:MULTISPECIES: WS/DGAT domain-containing protein [unclassified Nocardia]MEA3531030.1 WS/DGAT domain-containing protein [Nocardia sp. CDC192]MEB3509120.1 WS/DGAT domain-containing protein [Nocardia sp. CDC186]